MRVLLQLSNCQTELLLDLEFWLEGECQLQLTDKNQYYFNCIHCKTTIRHSIWTSLSFEIGSHLQSTHFCRTDKIVLYFERDCYYVNQMINACSWPMSIQAECYCLMRACARACMVPNQSMPRVRTLADQSDRSDQSAHLRSKTLPFTAFCVALHRLVRRLSNLAVPGSPPLLRVGQCKCLLSLSHRLPILPFGARLLIETTRGYCWKLVFLGR